MTQAEFIERHRHELTGIIIDAVRTPREGAELALWLRTMMRRIDDNLAKLYRDLYPRPDPLQVKWLEAFPAAKPAERKP